MASSSFLVLARTPRKSALALSLAGLGVAAPLFFSRDSEAQTVPAPYDCRSQDPTKWPASSKPYFMLAVDTSGSMLSCTKAPVPCGGGFGQPSCSLSNYDWDDSCHSTAPVNSCGLEPTRLNDAKCAVRKTIQAFAGEVSMGMATYAPRLSGCNAGATPDSCTDGSGACDPPDVLGTDGEFYSANGCTVLAPTNGNSCGNTPTCAGAAANNALIYNGTTVNASSTPPLLPGEAAVTGITLPADDWLNGGRIVVGIPKDTTWNPALQPGSNAPALLEWVDGRTDDSREIFALGSTPLEGMLRTVHQYYSAGWSSAWADDNYCATGGAAIDFASPIEPANDRPCRSLNVILVTDGDDTCSSQSATVTAARDLYRVGVVIKGVRVPVKTWVIGFAGATASDMNDIADAGNDGNPADNDQNAYFANDEVQLAQALSAIISSAVQPESCDNADNNCNDCIDEGSKLYCNRNKTARALSYLQTPANNPNLDDCCNWTNATERNACLTAYSGSISGAKPKGDRFFLPCWDPVSSGTSAETKWLCSDPGESCDELDNNCDVQILSAGAGFASNSELVSELAAEGVNKCGNPAACPVAEACPNDGADNNCDGVIDNAMGSGVPGSMCPGCVFAPEICNGCDDDCDGIADNGIPSLACGFSPPNNCAGTRACAPVAVASPGACMPGFTKPGTPRYGACSATPAPNDLTCDGLDENCNGVIDEGAPATACTNGQPGLVYSDVNPLSACVKGQQACGSTTCVGWVGPTTEVCDGVDNDCDGLVDAADPGLTGAGGQCGITQGICTKGTFACVGGVLVCQGGTQPQPEVCDGVDNDCDLAVDEGPLSDAPSQAGCWNPAAAPTTGKSCSHQGIGWNPPAGATCSGVGTLTSPCSAGTLTCGGNQGWTCQGGTLPSGEICDGQDNDCDGQLDQNDPSITGTGPNVNCGTDVGVCEFGDLLCVSGVPTCVGGTTPVPEICNNQDDDCDGTPDEGNPGGGASCGTNTGACQAGTTACVNGAIDCQGDITPSAEICDGIDNDCDGAIDDSLTDIPANLGCWNTAPGACTGGGRTWTAPPGATCTGLGTLTSPCAAGTLICSGLNKWECAGGQLPAASETCDNVDNDCDGQTDEGTGGGQCGTAPNVLPCRKGTFQCVAGQLSCQGEILPSNELCDNVDNDCDGTVDDGITSGVGNECGSNVGICRKGLTACVSGTVQCSGATGAGTETCNGLDDDCDGVVDNNLSDAPADPDCWNLPGTACTEKGVQWGRPAGVTDCKGLGGLTAPCAMGALTCVGQTGWACLGGLNPAAEICDGIDNDCDGTADDGNPGGNVSCGSDVGACEFGTRSCVGGQLTCSGGTPPSPETCNNIDDNCDGRVDEPENVVGLGQICGTDVGPCVSGILECGPGGVPVCRGEVKGTAETCNGIDDDCDGTVDELPTDAPADPGCWAVAGSTCSFRSLTWSAPAGATCTGTGTLQAPCAAGRILCQNGAWACFGGRVPEASEVCDGVNNDCVNGVDDGNPGGGGPCGNAAVGECRPGTTECRNGVIQCSGEVGPRVELCDGLDNDCDTQTDEGNPGGNKPCGDVVGVCTKGTTQCVRDPVTGSAVLDCVGGDTLKGPEICDGLDNDCNGLVDDGVLSDAPSDPACWPLAGTDCSHGTTTWSAPPGGTCTALGTLSDACALGALRCDGRSGWVCAGGKLPSTEVCDGKDNDCNGEDDNGVPVGPDCSSGCGTGKERCVNGVFQCDAPQGGAELCNGLDDDCDGTIDNLPNSNTACEMEFDRTVFAGDRSNPLCRPGTLVCDATLGREVCLGGVAPTAEVCNGLDDDCDGKVDEAGSAPDGMDGSPAKAGGVDVVLGAECEESVGACSAGTWVCLGGQAVCQRVRGPQPEICDCIDNDCDGQTDEDPAAGAGEQPVCGGGTTCVANGGTCQCAEKCQRETEFTDGCPLGTTCSTLGLSSDPTTTGRYCVGNVCPNNCAGAVRDTTGEFECGPPGTLTATGLPVPPCVCAGNAGCHGPCLNAQCEAGNGCVRAGDFAGECRPLTDCRFFPCPAGQACNAGACVANPCEPSPCAAGEVCKPTPTFDGTRCVGSCADVTCPAGQRCSEGACVDTGCGVDCAGAEVCGAVADGGKACGPNPCVKADGTPLCTDGSFCDPTAPGGSCGGNDPCAGVVCPSGQVCRQGDCSEPPPPPNPDGGAGGAGGTTGAGVRLTASRAAAADRAARPGRAARAARAASAGGADAGAGGGGANAGGGTGSDDDAKAVIGLATGGGGCRCDLPARSSGSNGALALGGLLVTVLATRRRARREGGAR